MFLFFSDQLIEIFSAFNAFTYITTRGILSALTALVISFLFGPKIISLLEGNDIGESIREDGPISHTKKKGTPTMGGILILLSVSVSTLIWSSSTTVCCTNITRCSDLIIWTVTLSTAIFIYCLCTSFIHTWIVTLPITRI